MPVKVSETPQNQATEHKLEEHFDSDIPEEGNSSDPVAEDLLFDKSSTENANTNADKISDKKEEKIKTIDELLDYIDDLTLSDLGVIRRRINEKELEAKDSSKYEKDTTDTTNTEKEITTPSGGKRRSRRKSRRRSRKSKRKSKKSKRKSHRRRTHRKTKK